MRLPSSDSLSLIDMKLYPDSNSGADTPVSTPVSTARGRAPQHHNQLDQLDRHGERHRHHDRRALQSVAVEELFALLQPDSSDNSSPAAGSLRPSLTHPQQAQRQRTVSLSLCLPQTEQEYEAVRSGGGGVGGSRPRAVSLPTSPLFTPPPLSPPHPSFSSPPVPVRGAAGRPPRSQTRSDCHTPSRWQHQRHQLAHYSPPSTTEEGSFLSPSPSASPLQEHMRDMSRILSHYSSEHSFRSWIGAVRSQSRSETEFSDPDEEWQGQEKEELKEETKEEGEGGVKRAKHQTRKSFLSPLAFVRKRSRSRGGVVVDMEEQKQEEKEESALAYTAHALPDPKSEGEGEWRDQRYKAISGEHDQLMEWEAQRDQGNRKQASHENYIGKGRGREENIAHSDGKKKER